MLQQGLWARVHSRPAKKLDSIQRSIAPVELAVIVGIVYFLSARLGLVLLTKPDGVAVFWPAAGVASGVLIALGPSARWPVAAGTMVATICAHLLGDRNIGLAVVSALCNAGEALLVAWLIEHNFGSNFALDNLRRVFGLIAAAAVSASLSGIGGTAGFILFHNSATPALTIWQHWFASDALGVVAIAPVLIGLASVIRNPPPMREVIEALAVIAAVVVTAWVAVFKLREPWGIIVPGALLYPIQLTLAARCQPFFSALTAFIVTLTVVCTTTFGLGQFFPPNLLMADRIIAAQASILVASISLFVLSALFAERRQHETAIAESESRMRAIVNTVVDGIITIDEQGTIENANPAAARIFGYNLEEVIHRNVRMLMPEPFRSEHDGYLSNYRETGQAKIIGKGRGVTGKRKDGSVFPMELAISEMNVAGRAMFTGIVRDITNRKRAEDHQAKLVAELDHRVKNILAQVGAVATSTRRGSRSIDEFLGSLDGRIQSLAIAHNLLSATGWRSVGLNALARSLLAPYAIGANITISGSDVVLDAAEIQAMARVLHELATNAAKYGALSMPDGQVSVDWGVKPNGAVTNLILVWRELGGPPVSCEHPFSYGTTLIRNLIPHELGGTVDLVFAKEGVNCRIEIPVRQA